VNALDEPPVFRHASRIISSCFPGSRSAQLVENREDDGFLLTGGDAIRILQQIPDGEVVMRKQYEEPRIETLSASQIIEGLGPVSCGSGGTDANSPLGVVSNVTSGSSGYAKPN
jgi:hypothetical protein